jgi:uncharacterized membrane protein YfcA
LEGLIYFILLAILAEILGTVGGFGSSMFFVPIASYFLDFHSVLGITALFHVMSNLTKIYFFRHGFDKKLIYNLGIPALVFVLIGAFLSKYFEKRILEILLSVFLIGISLLFLFIKNLRVPPTTRNSIGGGVISGFAAGLIGTGGAIRGIVLSSYNLKTEIFIATSAIIDLGIDSGRSVVYTLNGYVHYNDLYLLPILLGVSILGTYTGKKILKFVSETQFKKIVLLLVLATGLITLFKFL